MYYYKRPSLDEDMHESKTAPATKDGLSVGKPSEREKARLKQGRAS